MLSSSVHMGHVDLPRNVRPASRNTLSTFRRDLRQLLRCRCNTRVTTGNEPTTAAGLSSVGVSTAEAAPHSSQLGDSVAQQQPGTNSNLEAPINSVAAAAGTQAGLLGSGVSVDPQHKQAQQQQAAQFGLWPVQGLLSGTCLIAAGALACSFISLQVKLFDHHVPPLQVTAWSSAVAWVATSVILQQQQHHQHQQHHNHHQHQQQEQHQPGQPAQYHEPVPRQGAQQQQQQAEEEQRRQQQQDVGQQQQEFGKTPQLSRAPAGAAVTSGAGAAEVAEEDGFAPSTKSLLLLRGLLGAATVTAYYAAVEDLPLSVAVALFFFHPVLALLLNAAVTKSTVSPQAAGSCALTVLGVLVIGWHDQLMLHLKQAAVFVSDLNREGFAGAAAAAASVGDDAILGPELSLYGVVMGVIAAAANAAAFVVVGLIGKEVSPLNVCWWQYCVTTHAAIMVLLLSQLEATVVQSSAAASFFNPELLLQQQQGVGVVALSTPLAANLDSLTSTSQVTGLGLPSSPLDLHSMGHVLQDSALQLQQSITDSLPSQHDALLLCGVVVANFAGQLLLNAGFQRVDAGRGAAVNTLQVLFANVWDVVLLGGQLSAAMVAGSGMIAAGVVGTRQSAAAAPAAAAAAAAPPAASKADGLQQAHQQQQQQEKHGL